jgi:putative transcriptional regulator
LLLAHPVLRDSHFRRTAILMSAHDAEGAMGVVLNRPLNRKLGEFSGDFALGPLADVPVFDGGPMEKRQIILCAWRPHGDANEDGFQLLFGLDRERASELVSQDGVELRAFLGYAGWSGGQLEGELKRDTWVVADLEPEIIRQPADESLWRKVLGNLDPQWRLLACEPDDPGLN